MSARIRSTSAWTLPRPQGCPCTPAGKPANHRQVRPGAMQDLMCDYKVNYTFKLGDNEWTLTGTKCDGPGGTWDLKMASTVHLWSGTVLVDIDRQTLQGK